jgi:hypothetical protein
MSEKSGNERRTGALMVEYAIGLSVLAVGILAFMSTLFSNYQAANATTELDEAHLALENLSETLRAQPLADVYANYNARQFPVAGLKAPEGGAAQLVVTCHVNETAIPAQCGPVSDIDGNPGEQSADCSGDYLILPVRLSITYATPLGPETQERFLVLGSSE